MATVKDMLKCPKCGKQTMGKAHPQKWGREYYAHCCQEYFGVNELVNQWNYDAGDLYPYYPVTHGNYKNWLEMGTLIITPTREFSPKFYDGETGEPYWLTEQERNSAYRMVSRMFMGIEEIDDYADMLNTQYDALGIGVQ